MSGGWRATWTRRVRWARTPWTGTAECSARRIRSPTAAPSTWRLSCGSEGDARSARALDEQAVTGLRDTVGQDHHYTLSAAVNLASDLAALGDHAAAGELGEDTLSRLRTVMGEDHPYTLACALNLALDRRACGDTAGGDALFTDALGRLRACLGPDHPDAAAAAAGERLNCDFESPPT